MRLNNSLDQVVIQSKKSQHKSNSFRQESISKLPGGMALFLGGSLRYRNVKKIHLMLL